MRFREKDGYTLRPMSWNGQERRRKKRYGIRGSTLVYRKGGLLALLRPVSPKYLLLNISPVGCHFISKDELKCGQPVLLSIEAPKVSGTIHARGRVVWTAPSQEMPAFRVGVELAPVSGRSSVLLKNLLDTAILEKVEIATTIYMKEIEKL